MCGTAKTGSCAADVRGVAPHSSRGLAYAGPQRRAEVCGARTWSRKPTNTEVGEPFFLTLSAPPRGILVHSNASMSAVPLDRMPQPRPAALGHRHVEAACAPLTGPTLLVTAPRSGKQGTV